MSKKKYIETPDELYALWAEYKQWCRGNPFLKQEAKATRDGVQIVNLRQERPATIQGFEAWLSQNDIIDAGVGDYWRNAGDAYDEFKDVVSRIKKENHGLLLDGALSHVWNPNLAGRVLGIAQIVENRNTDTTKIEDLSPESLEKLKEIVDEKFNNQGTV